MSSDFGLRGPKTPWVCPNDRQLALRAKLQTGWSIKTSSFNTYPKPQPLTETEQQMIVSVIKKAEELDLCEQKRVGKLVDRLESLKKLASGNGTTECVLCGDSFGLSVFGRNSFKCSDCEKAVCRKCVVELVSPMTSSSQQSSTATKDPILRLCKICSENRELIKRSGAWFYKGVPKHILPEKKAHYGGGNRFENPPTTQCSYQEKRYLSRYLNSHLSNSSCGPSSSSSNSINTKRMGVLWSKGLAGRSQSEGDNDSSSGDETAASTIGAKFSSERLRLRNKSKLTEPNDLTCQPPTPPQQPTRTTSSTTIAAANSSTVEVQNHLYEIAEPSNLSDGGGGLLKQKSFERFDPPVFLDQGVILSDNNPRSSRSSSNDGLVLSSASQTSPSSSSTLQSQSSNGTVELSILYDDAHQALHCTVHKAKDLAPMDLNGLSDPYCVLKLIPTRFEGAHHRTKTVHKTVQPVFNETLTFYGVSHNDLAWQTLQINVMDDDIWGRDCLGSGQIPLHKMKSQQTRSFTLSLERGRSNDDKEWGHRGRVLVSLCYLTEKSQLLVGVLRAQDLPALDASGTSDPFVKVRLLHDSNSGALSTTSSHCVNRKYKTHVKWKTLNPDFNEEFSLKVSVMDLPRLALLISVWDKDLGKRNDYIGGTMLSCGSKGDRVKHWTDMMKLPNTKHTKWHTLSPAELPMH